MADPRRAELIQKLTALVRTRFSGDFSEAFSHYATAGLLGENELYTLFQDAGIGSWFTRKAYVRGLLAAVDTTGDDAVSYDEFEAVVMQRGKAGTADAAELMRQRCLAFVHRLSAECNVHEPEESFALGLLGRLVTLIESNQGE